MVAAIVCAAYFGDNIAPVSDTTIASAYTQGTDVPKVVRTRLKYALTAAAISCVLFVLFGGGGETVADGIPQIGELSPEGLLMLVVPVVLIAMMFRGSHLIIALMYSGVLGIIVGILSGLLDPASLLVIDMEQFRVGGVIVDGINGLMDIAIFAFLLMGLVGLLEKGGFLEMVTERTKRLTATPRNSELTISAVLILMNLLTVASTIVIIMVGPLARKILVQENGISPERSANILDAVSAGAMCLIPYGFGPLLAYMFAGGSEMPVDFSLISVIPYMFHGWALLAVMAFAVFSGWGRDYLSDEQAAESKVIEEEPVYGT
jgi:Na+/H+ antiporter NhaC